MTPARYRATLATSVQESFSTRAEALERERQIKGWTRQKKGALIRGDWDLLQTLARGGGSTGYQVTGLCQVDSGGLGATVTFLDSVRCADITLLTTNGYGLTTNGCGSQRSVTVRPELVEGQGVGGSTRLS